MKHCLFNGRQSLSPNKHYLVVGDVAGIVARLIDKKSGLADREKRHVTFFKPTGDHVKIQ